MALKVYIVGNTLRGDDQNGNMPFNPAISTYGIEQGTFTLIEYGNMNKRKSAKVGDVQNESGTPIGDEDAIHAYMADKINFKTGSGGSGPSDPINYRADNYTGILAVATNPQLNELAYARNPEGTSWLPFSVGGTYRPSGLWWYNGSEWISDRYQIAEQLQLNIDDIELLETNVAQNDADIITLNSGLATEVATRAAADLSLSGRIDTEEAARITGDNDLMAFIEKVTWRSFIQSQQPLINQTANFEPYFIQDTLPNVDNTGTWTVVFPYDGDYELILDYRYSINNTTQNFQAHILMDGLTFLMPFHIESKDAGGVGIVTNVVQNDSIVGTANTGTDQLLAYSGRNMLIGITAGETRTFRLEFNATSNVLEPCIYESIFGIRFVNNKNV